jgi:hypothetical protein
MLIEGDCGLTRLAGCAVLDESAQYRESEACGCALTMTPETPDGRSSGCTLASPPSASSSRFTTRLKVAVNQREVVPLHCPTQGRRSDAADPPALRQNEPSFLARALDHSGPGCTGRMVRADTPCLTLARQHRTRSDTIRHDCLQRNIVALGSSGRSTRIGKRRPHSGGPGAYRRMHASPAGGAAHLRRGYKLRPPQSSVRRSAPAVGGRRE